MDATELDHTDGVTGIVDPLTEELLFEVSWGSWSAEPGTVGDGDIAGFSYAVTDPGNFTTATEIQALNAGGTLNYRDAGGPQVIGSEGGNWEVSEIRLDVTFGDGAIDAARIAVEDISAEEYVEVSAGIEALEPIGALDSDGSFSVDELTGSTFSGEFEGRFLGTNAEGALMAFEIQEIEGERQIVGTRILEKTTVP